MIESWENRWTWPPLVHTTPLTNNRKVIGRVQPPAASCMPSHSHVTLGKIYIRGSTVTVDSADSAYTSLLTIIAQEEWIKGEAWVDIIMRLK